MDANRIPANGKAVETEYKPNLDYLNELSGGDTGFVAEIIQMFIKDAPSVLQQVQQYLTNNNYDLLRITVHKMKSSVQVLGSHHLARLMKEIETGAQKGEETARLDALIREMAFGIENLTNHLSIELKKLHN